MSPVERLVGAADAESTARSASRLGPHAAAPLGTTGLTVSRLGFGGYRVDDAHPLFAQALGRALQGCNLIDTSTNYTDGGSERLIGEVLTAEHTAHRLRREDVVVVSKVGYVQGQNLLLATAARRDGQKPAAGPRPPAATASPSPRWWSIRTAAGTASTPGGWPTSSSAP